MGPDSNLGAGFGKQLHTTNIALEHKARRACHRMRIMQLKTPLKDTPGMPTLGDFFLFFMYEKFRLHMTKLGFSESP